MKCEEVNFKLNILIDFKIHVPILTHRTYKILNLRMEGIQSRAQKPPRFHRGGFFVLGACKARFAKRTKWKNPSAEGARRFLYSPS